MMKTAVARLWLVALVMFLAGRPALAQSAIAGVVKDSSGAVLPGVTVEASSPALIEKMKSASRTRRASTASSTSAPAPTGHVHAERLRHGGARGILLEANFTAPINVEMRVGVGRRERHRHRREPGGGRADQPAPEVVVAGNARSDSDRPQLRAHGGHGARPSPPVRSTSAARARCGSAAACWCTARSAGDSRDAHRRDGRRRDVRQRPMLVRLRQRSADAGNGGAGVGGAAENQLSGVLVNRIPKYRRQPVHRRRALPLLERAACRATTSDDDLRARGITTPARLCREYDVNYSARRADSQGQAVVLRLGSQLGLQQLRRQRLQRGRQPQAIDDNNAQGVSRCG